MVGAVNYFKIENGTFKGFSEEIRIPHGIRRIAPLALAPLTNMKILVLPDTVEHFAPSDLRKPYDTSTKSTCGFWGIKAHPQRLQEIHILGESQLYRSENGVLYSADGKRLIYLPPSHHYETVEIREGALELSEESCCFVAAKKIVFPETLLRVSDRACCASNLSRSMIPSCEIGRSAFQGSVLPKYVDIYNEVIPEKAFANCSGVKGIRLHHSVRLVKNEAFSYTDIRKIYIPAQTQIEANAFVREKQRLIGSEAVQRNNDGLREVRSNYEKYMENDKELIIGGESGSPAEAFAGMNGIPFEVVGKSDEEIKAWLGWQERDEGDAEIADGIFCF